ncbi:MAG TPA: hypothetical protein VJS43_00220 [Candidatus Acidoferrales bacterium]|nr:hypothetical protein [Candidatus Acidoferrales bacterium]
MRNALLHKASELKPETRAALERELGRPLQDDEGVSILTYPPHDEPQGEDREAVAQRLRTYFAEADARGTESEEEVEQAIQEAMRSVRPGYRERK